MKKPHFLIIGAQKAGTTNFWWILNQHPEIAMTPRKELHYFLRHTEYPDHEWYSSQFVDDGRITGEATPSYCFWPGAIEKINEYDSDMKLIMLLRDPVKRAISQYWMEFQANHEHLPISVALRGLSNRQFSVHSTSWQHGLYHHSYLERGLYHIQIDRILEFFPKEQLHIQLLEDFMVAPNTVMAEVAEFLEVNTIEWEYSVDHGRKKGEYPDTDSDLLEYLYQQFERPNRLLQEKHHILTDVWRLDSA